MRDPTFLPLLYLLGAHLEAAPQIQRSRRSIGRRVSKLSTSWTHQAAAWDDLMPCILNGHTILLLETGTTARNGSAS